MVLLPSFYDTGQKAIEAESKQRIAELEAERERLKMKERDKCYRFENLRLRAENARLKGDKRSAARLEVEVVSLKVELENIERQIATITKKLEEEKSRSVGSILLPFWLLPTA